MKILLIGHGKMGKLIAESAPEFGIEIAHIADSKQPLSAKMAQDVAVAIDFSSPQNILSRIELLLSHNIPIVIGTTGWLDAQKQAQALVQKHQGALFYSANFSMGAFLFVEVVKEAAALFSKLDHYDVGCIETHHNQKKDHPSGTARMIAEAILENMHSKKKILTELSDGAIAKDALHIASLRTGSFPGKHEVIFDGPDDTITICHTARTRNDFARGALISAQWLIGKKGFFTMKDMLCK